MLPSCPRVLLSCSWFGCAGCGSACRLRTKGKDAACVACLLVAVLAVRAGDDRASFPGAFRAGRACPELRLAALGIIAILIVLWFANGGPERADLRGMFLAPPAPVGPGNAHGPQVGQPNPNIPQ